MRLELIIIVKKYLEGEYSHVEVADWGQIKYRTRKILSENHFKTLDLDGITKAQRIKPHHKVKVDETVRKALNNIKVFTTL